MKRRLKTLQKILEENPCYHFNADNTLVVNSKCYKSFHLFGLEVDPTKYTYPDDFYEPLLEKKVRKLYAFCKKCEMTPDQVVFFKEEVDGLFGRDPDYDIVYKDEEQ